MTNKKPKCIISFHGEEYSKEEQEYLIFRFVKVLQRLDKEQRAKKLKESENFSVVD